MMRRALSAFLLFAILASPMTALALNAIQIPAEQLVTDGSAPVAVSDAYLLPDRAHQVVLVCFSFRNLATASIESVEFHAGMVDQFDTERLGRDLVRNAKDRFPSGHLVQPPDPSSSVDESGDGSVSCWPLVTASDLSKFQGVDRSAKLKVDVIAVRFSDGSTWHRGGTFTRAYNADGSPYVLQPPNFNTTWTTETDSAPIAILAARIHSYATYDNRAKFKQCVSFRNITNKTASSISISYIFSNHDGKALPDGDDYHYQFDGTYTPPVEIDDQCWHADLPPARLVHAIGNELIRVTDVHFTDGSEWKRGDGWTKTYGADGSTLPSPLAMTGSSGGSTNPASPANPSNPSSVSGIGGVIGPSGQLYGEVAWDMSLDGGYGISLNQASAFDAQYQAMSQCKARAGANAANCTLITQGKALNSPSTRCVTLLTDGHVYHLGVGATPDEADLDAITQLHAAGGIADQARTIAKGCNNN